MGVLNNPTISGDNVLKNIFDTGKVKYTCGQLEKGEQGTIHVQFYVCFDG